MKIWMIVAIFGLMAVAGFVIADSFEEEVVVEEVASCGSSSCDGSCESGKSCGSLSCGATVGKSCGCGSR